MTDTPRRLAVEQLAAAHRAAKAAGASAGRWWKELSAAADTTTTFQALDALFHEAMAAIADALGVDTVALLLANEAGDELVARVASGLVEEATVDLGIRAGEGMAGWVLARRSPLIVADLATITLVSPTLRLSGLHSVAAVPVLSDEHPLGVLYAASRELDRFGAADVDVLELLADRLAAAIERVRLFETEREARREAEELAVRLARTQRVTSRLAAAVSIEDVANAVAESLVEGPDAEIVWTSVWIQRSGLMTMVAQALEPARTMPEPEPIPIDGPNPLAEVARTGQALYLDDPDEVARRFPVTARAFTDPSVALVPISLGAPHIGVLSAVFGNHHVISERERTFLATVANQVAQALERARLSALYVQLSEMNAFFARVARVVAEGADLADTLDRLASMALPALGDICLIDVVSETGGISRMVARHRDPDRQPVVTYLRTRYPPSSGGVHPAVAVIRTGETRWSPLMSDAFLAETTQSPEHFELVKSLGFRSYISVPLRSREETLGSLTLVSVTRSFGPDDVAFAELLAEHVAAVVYKARGYDIATRTSHVLQSTLLPARLPEVPGLSVHTRYVVASEGLEVGGDFYDLVSVGGDRVAFLIGDVAGHDRVAAALMGQLRSAVRTLVDRVRSPAEMVRALQRSWIRLDFDRMATGIFGLLDVSTGEVALVSAGHYPPVRFGRRPAAYVDIEPCPPLGVPGPVAPEWRGQLEPGEGLLFYTDGLIDERVKGSEHSMEDLLTTVDAGSPAEQLEALCDRLVALLAPQRSDDAALLALRLEV